MTWLLTTSEPLDVSSWEESSFLIQRVLQGITRRGTGTALDFAALEVVNTALQLLRADSPVPYTVDGPTAAVAYLYDVAESADCALYGLLTCHLPPRWSVAVPDHSCLSGTSRYGRAVADPGELTVVTVSRIPGQHGFTERCSNQIVHSSVLNDARKRAARRHPEWPSGQVETVAKTDASREWNEALSEGRIRPCSRHAVTCDQFREAIQLTINLVNGVSATMDEIVNHRNRNVRRLVNDLLREPIQMSESQHTLHDGQARVCAARLCGVMELPVLIVE